jgi:Uri superfamily endonuclease
MMGRGTYALIVEVPGKLCTPVGGLGRLTFLAGRFAYVGSALGPGGLAARLRRHAVGPRRLHWHIDYLLDHAQVSGALVREGRVRHECTWASWFSDRCGSAADGFGASDCRCPSHLFFLGSAQNAEQIVLDASLQLTAHPLGRAELTGVS